MLSLRHVFALVAAVVSGGLGAARGEEVRFNRDVRPILSNHCFACHGPDEKKREAKLRLDDRENATNEREGVRAIVPGKPDASELIVRILTHDADEVMPPPKSKKPVVTPAEVATLRKWIEQGAEYESHWAFMPLATGAVPIADCGLRIADWERREPQRGTELRGKQKFLESWVQNPIDQFILNRLLREGITPSPEADSATLCRRLFLDLTGLLPSPEEVAAFAAQSIRDPQFAIRDLADRLLASPHYGERWGRHWLDQARYADSNGYAIDNDRGMWPFRDWVIKALNDDLPFDRFTIEQLAGDLLPKATKSQLIASAFHRNTLINEEGGVDKEQFRNEAVVDRVNTTGAVWLGLTVGCAQCHTHKFDPITHREYYELFSFFNQGTDVNNKGETIPVMGNFQTVDYDRSKAPPGAQVHVGDEKQKILRVVGETPSVVVVTPGFVSDNRIFLRSGLFAYVVHTYLAVILDRAEYESLLVRGLEVVVEIELDVDRGHIAVFIEHDVLIDHLVLADVVDAELVVADQCFDVWIGCVSHVEIW